MKQARDREQLEALRNKLYARSSAVTSVEQHELSDTPVEVSRNWQLPKKGKNTEDLRQAVAVTGVEVFEEPETPKPRRRYRIVIMVISLLVFIFGVGLSSLYLYMGGNQIGSDQIGIAVTGPFTIGGGEVIDLQVVLENDNAVPIESAILIMKYPPGTRSVGEAPRTIFEDRIPIDAIASGEVRNVPIKVAIFGEEQSEQEITATLEYRIAGSNSTFYKDAEPFTFSVSSSPIILRLESVEKVASGQTVTIDMTVVSNASEPLRDLILNARYPNGFRFEAADPSPVFSDTVWRIDELMPEESKTITISGVVVGLTEESFRLHVDAGPAQADNPYLVGSTLSEASLDFFIERPFIDVVTQIDGISESPVVLAQDDAATVSIDLKNTLDESVYDVWVEVVPGGNILTETSISSGNGFYDSNSGTIRWEVANNGTFSVVRPGEQRNVSFSIQPSEARTTASFDLVVNVYARRVAETNAAEQLIGTAQIGAKYSSQLFFGSQASRNDVFVSAGPLPPMVGEETTYTLTMVAEAGVNDLTDVIADTSLPVYVEWLDTVEGDGEITYNPVSKQLQWDAGNILSNDRKQISFQVSITPSVSQVGDMPALLKRQTIRGTDRFTEARLAAESDPVFTELSEEAGYEADNGIIRR